MFTNITILTQNPYPRSTVIYGPYNSNGRSTLRSSRQTSVTREGRKEALQMFADAKLNQRLRTRQINSTQLIRCFWLTTPVEFGELKDIYLYRCGANEVIDGILPTCRLVQDRLDQ